TKERLEKLRENQIKKKMPPGYDGLCRNLTKEELLAKKDASYVIRFKMPKNGVAKWDDKIRGEMKINFDISDDPIILKTDGFPTYHLASVVDDHELKITDVIRGEEWISSTPKHLALYEALGWQPPGFAHMPHINGPDGSKLSKRHGDTALLDYRARGYLPEAIFNFLALLGWNDGTEKEIFEKKELIKSFNLKRIGKSPAVFDIKKLDWMNGHYIRNLTTEQLKNKIIKLLPGSKITKLKNLDRILEVEKTRLVVLCDIEKETDFYLDAPKYDAKLLIFKKSNKTDTLKGLTETLQYFEAERWPDTVKGLNLSLGNVAANHNLSNGDVFWPARVALSGLEKSPSPAELLWVLGKKESLKRIKKAINLLK
ncbi:MAG: glutamate--tRNA ligase, partial [Patescibacteria group bacterium]|nr:glutamate--tRNA ligase [Patescibacteria group bacterium]